MKTRALLFTALSLSLLLASCGEDAKPKPEPKAEAKPKTVGVELDLTRLVIKKAAEAVEQYRLDVGAYPTEAGGGLPALVRPPIDLENPQVWRGPYAQSKDLIDAWGNPLSYALLSKDNAAGGVQFKIWSNGPDEQSNTEDDILNFD